MKGDFLVDTNDPVALDSLLQTFGAVLMGGPEHFTRHIPRLRSVLCGLRRARSASDWRVSRRVLDRGTDRVSLCPVVSSSGMAGPRG